MNYYLKMYTDDLSQYVDSMLFDSGETIAKLTYGNWTCYVDVSGEKKIWFKDEQYRYVQDYPEELIEAFKNGTAYDNPNINICDNNWFDIVVYQDGEYIADDVVEDDISKYNKKQLKEMMKEYLNEVIRYYKIIKE